MEGKQYVFFLNAEIQNILFKPGYRFAFIEKPVTFSIVTDIAMSAVKLTRFSCFNIYFLHTTLTMISCRSTHHLRSIL
jgi:hypothetical protein